MTWESWVMLGLLVLMAVAILRGLGVADTVLLAGLSVVMGLGTFSDRFPDAPKAVAGFGSKPVVTIGVLFVVAEGLRQNGAMATLTRPLLGNPKSLPAAQARLMLPVAGLSAFLKVMPGFSGINLAIRFTSCSGMPKVRPTSRRAVLAPMVP